MSELKIGIVGYHSYTGLGNLIKWYKKFLPITHHFVIKIQGISIPEYDKPETVQIKEFFTNFSVEKFKEHLEKIKDEINVLMIIETPFEFEILKIAHDLGIKVVVIPMVDALSLSKWNPYIDCIDAFFCPTYICYDIYKAIFNSKVFYLPYPIDTDYFNYDKNISEPTGYFFLHNQGNGGAHWRKGTEQIYFAYKDLTSRKEITSKTLIRRQPDLHPTYLIPNDVNEITQVEIRYKEPRELYRDGNVYIAPSKREGLGLPILEAMSVGYPVLTTDAPPMNEYITDKRFLIKVIEKHEVPTGNVYRYILSLDDLKEKMKLIIKLSKTERTSIGFANRKKIEKHYSWKVLLPLYIKRLKEILK